MSGTGTNVGGRPPKRENDHKYLARIDSAVWEKIVTFAKTNKPEPMSLNDAVNEILAAGVKRMKL